jgi:hypothetical protein
MAMPSNKPPDEKLRVVLSVLGGEVPAAAVPAVPAGGAP